MQIVTVVLAALAALLHVYIFVMESLTWTSAKTRAVFGLSQAQAEQTKELAFNQGFYNLFLAVTAAVGAVLMAADELTVGRTLVFAGTGMMLAAAVVLLVSSPDKAKAAITQGTVPLLAVLGCVFTLL